jgi:hypothetical protein
VVPVVPKQSADPRTARIPIRIVEVLIR